jgi:hypothetical protein
MNTFPSHIKSVFFALVFIFGCKHASIRDMQGRIEDENGNPLEGASVTIRYHVPNSGKNANGQYHYDSLTTDASGKYRFNFRKKMAWEYWLIIRHPNYATSWFDIGRIKNPTNVQMTRSIGHFSIRVKKKTNAPSKIKVQFDDRVYSFSSASPFDSLIINSKMFWTSLYYPLTWDVDSVDHHSASIYVDKGDFKTFLIEYD